MRIAIAIVVAIALASIGIAMLRTLRTAAPSNIPLPEPELPPANVRVTYWCQECGTELLLIRKGSESPPRHCAEPMTKREEVARGP